MQDLEKREQLYSNCQCLAVAVYESIPKMANPTIFDIMHQDRQDDNLTLMVGALDPVSFAGTFQKFFLRQNKSTQKDFIRAWNQTLNDYRAKAPSAPGIAQSMPGLVRMTLWLQSFEGEEAQNNNNAKSLEQRIDEAFDQWVNLLHEWLAETDKVSFFVKAMIVHQLEELGKVKVWKKQ